MGVSRSLRSFIGFVGELIWRRATNGSTSALRLVLFLTAFPIFGYAAFVYLILLAGFSQFIG